MAEKLTIRDIAQIAGVSIATVSQSGRWYAAFIAAQQLAK
jgi:hypothetical protein